jgi:hypothetical protein
MWKSYIEDIDNGTIPNVSKKTQKAKSKPMTLRERLSRAKKNPPDSQSKKQSFSNFKKEAERISEQARADLRTIADEFNIPKGGTTFEQIEKRSIDNQLVNNLGRLTDNNLRIFSDEFSKRRLAGFKKATKMKIYTAKSYITCRMTFRWCKIPEWMIHRDSSNFHLDKFVGSDREYLLPFPKMFIGNRVSPEELLIAQKVAKPGTVEFPSVCKTLGYRNPEIQYEKSGYILNVEGWYSMFRFITTAMRFCSSDPFAALQRAQFRDKNSIWNINANPINFEKHFSVVFGDRSNQSFGFEWKGIWFRVPADLAAQLFITGTTESEWQSCLMYQAMTYQYNPSFDFIYYHMKETQKELNPKPQKEEEKSVPVEAAGKDLTSDLGDVIGKMIGTFNSLSFKESKALREHAIMRHSHAKTRSRAIVGSDLLFQIPEDTLSDSESVLGSVRLASEFEEEGSIDWNIGLEPEEVAEVEDSDDDYNSDEGEDPNLLKKLIEAGRDTIKDNMLNAMMNTRDVKFKINDDFFIDPNESVKDDKVAMTVISFEGRLDLRKKYNEPP